MSHSAPSPLWITATGKYFIYAYVKAGVALPGLPAEMAITQAGIPPEPADWHSAAWDGNRTRILVGPAVDGGVIELDPASKYSVWVRVTTVLERPEMYSGDICTYGGL